MKFVQLRVVGACMALCLLHHPVIAQDAGYEIGLGKSVNDWLTLGGYFSTEYEKSSAVQQLQLDDVAVMAYGEFSNRFSYLLELESVKAYVADLERDTRSSNFPPTIERLYFDYKGSDHLSVRAGKQITPVGYWNQQPINVLRETSSNPRFSKEMVPKFLTGIDVHGFAPLGEDLTYHVYLQNSRDMDESNINIKPESHYGFALAKQYGNGWRIGGSAGRFKEAIGSASGTRTATRYWQLNSRFDNQHYSLIAEGIVNTESAVGAGRARSKAVYVQGEYRYRPRHSLISRLEYFHDTGVAVPERIGILGYSFRPVFPVSLKFEYQWHQESSNNRFVSSFSVLF